MFTVEQKAQIGARVAEGIKKSGKPRAWFAREIGVERQHITKICRTGSMSLEVAAHLSLLLGMTLDQLVFGNGSKIPRADPAFAEFMRELLKRLPEHQKP